MALAFEWDAAKAEVNRRKHGVSFDEAATVFDDPLSLTIKDTLHSVPGEERLVIVGLSAKRRLLVVVHSEYENVVRIITARTATRRERRAYEEK